MDFTGWTPEYFSANEAACVELLGKPEVRAQLPLLNCTQLHDLRDNALVRFRGMIQDMQDPECYLEQYEVRRKGDGSVLRVQNGRYRDVVAMNKDEEQVDFQASSNKYGERRSMFVISIPGYNSWAVECEERICGPATGSKENKNGDGGQRVPKRLHEAGEEMETDDVGSTESVFKKPMLPAEPSEQDLRACSSKSVTSKNQGQTVLSAEYLLNSPIPERPSKACLVKLYSDTEDTTLNSLVDVVGFLSVDPALDGSTDEKDVFMDEMTEHQATNPPPSLIPRIHAISVQKLKHLNPLLDTQPESQPLESIDIWKDIQNLLTQCLFGDKIAADYLFCHLLSTVYIRTVLESLGQFSLNLSNVPAEVLPDYTPALYEILELLLPASHYFPMTLENMNTMQFVPKKDYSTNKLTSGLLQLAPHTHLLLDETRLQTGKLESSGVEAVQNIAYLIKAQKLKYNFQFYQLEFNSDVPVMILSEGKSMLPTNCHLPMVPDVDSLKLIGETLKAGKHYIQPKLTEMRKFLTMQRIQEFDMKMFDPEIIENDFVQMRKQSDASADDLHSLLVLARLVGLSRGKRTMDRDCWEYAKELERERKRRIDMFTKKKNEP